MVNETGDEGVSPVSRLAARAERSRDQRGAVRTGAAAPADWLPLVREVAREHGLSELD